jgi:branched-chain amino acid transport system ATP-binding protein
MPILKTENLCAYFGGLKAVSNLTLNIEQGGLVGLIGPNGAGKTTTFNLLTGNLKPDSGKIIFKGKNIAGYKPYMITRLGIARTFQNIRLFKGLTVLDNVRIAHHHKIRYGLFESMFFRFGRLRREESDLMHKSLNFLDIFGLRKYSDEKAQNLPYGLQRRLEIARALATEPTLLLLDEPAAGMHPQETKELMDLISFIRKKFELTILLIEHDMNLVMGICEFVYVLDYGELIASGAPDKIKKNKKVIEAYLGDEAG